MQSYKWAKIGSHRFQNYGKGDGTVFFSIDKKNYICNIHAYMLWRKKHWKSCQLLWIINSPRGAQRVPWDPRTLGPWDPGTLSDPPLVIINKLELTGAAMEVFSSHHVTHPPRPPPDPSPTPPHPRSCPIYIVCVCSVINLNIIRLINLYMNY